MSGTPYMAGPFTLEVAGGEEACIDLNIPWRGTIAAIKFNHASGVDADCDFELYTKAEACPPTSSSSGSSLSSSAAAAPNRALFSVFGEKNYVAGTPFAEFNQSYPYVNQDSKASDPTRKLYLRIIATGTGVKVYELALEILTSQLG